MSTEPALCATALHTLACLETVLCLEDVETLSDEVTVYAEHRLREELPAAEGEATGLILEREALGARGNVDGLRRRGGLPCLREELAGLPNTECPRGCITVSCVHRTR